MLYLIGLGLGDKKDITIKGFEIIKRCKRVYLESYTSILVNDKKELEEFYGREVISADREFVEIGADQILADADHEDIAFLVVGDPLGNDERKKEYLPPTFMTVNVAAQQLIESFKELGDKCKNANLTEETICVALARVGCENQKISKCTLKEMLEVNLGPPLHSLIVVGKLHPIEEEMLKLFEQ
ncbi:hypothetical protein RDWZM_003577 [Blomia tropicalis]|uniref:diphthine methyl ester synthase n=1 Tax=Blomia tropicalis TaxID=40697 RepID=A0A9Q0MIH8_BLOTA|nr:hypothetical protein RDWZM_003577 [Blomia tropicalis]